MKLWQSKNSTPLDPMIERFTIGSDLYLDEYLIGYDAAASAAHAYMLTQQGYLKKTEFAKVKKVLKEIYSKAVKHGYRLQGGRHEDGHSAIESVLTKKLGELGGKIHLGRSRNDQSATAIRLFAKNELFQIRTEILNVIEMLLQRAQKYAQVPMPGYTHMRPAMVSTLGHFFAAFAESLTDDYITVAAASELSDSCPLGGAAGYGTTATIDRALTSRLLGFAKVQNNTLAVQISRGKLETAILSALTNVGLTLSRLANDLIYFSAPEFDFFSLTEAVATGSSIMPQKRNPDALEIIRGNAGMLVGYTTQIATITKGLPAGYQRDLQLTKHPFIEGVKTAKYSLRALQIVLNNLIVAKDKLRTAASRPELFAANIANDLVLKKGLSFREAYRQVKTSYTQATFRSTGIFDDTPDFNPLHNIAKKSGLGMPGNLNLGSTKRLAVAAKRATNAEQRKFTKAIQKIWQL